MKSNFLKNKILIHIQEHLIKMKLTQKEMGKILDIKQPKVSRILTGYIEDFSLDTLIEYTELLGFSIELNIIYEGNINE